VFKTVLTRETLRRAVKISLLYTAAAAAAAASTATTGTGVRPTHVRPDAAGQNVHDGDRQTETATGTAPGRTDQVDDGAG